MSVVSKLLCTRLFVVVKSFGVVHFFRVVLPKFEEFVHLVAAGFKLTNLVLLPPRLAPLLEWWLFSRWFLPDLSSRGNFKRMDETNLGVIVVVWRTTIGCCCCRSCCRRPSSDRTSTSGGGASGDDGLLFPMEFLGFLLFWHFQCFGRLFPTKCEK